MSSTNYNSFGTPQNENGQSLSAKNDNQNDAAEEKPVRKSFMEKIKEALRDWSAKDAQDQAYDDSRV